MDNYTVVYGNQKPKKKRVPPLSCCPLIFPQDNEEYELIKDELIEGMLHNQMSLLDSRFDSPKVKCTTKLRGFLPKLTMLWQLYDIILIMQNLV